MLVWVRVIGSVVKTPPPSNVIPELPMSELRLIAESLSVSSTGGP
ncbi:MAG: hypothetical protein QOF68_2601, partial [Gaiellales bacterium]|nr:hypothetical protein [Gaiellales bacterium]